MTELQNQELSQEIEKICITELKLLNEKLDQIPDHDFSPNFERKMKRLFFRRKIRYDVIFNTVGKKVAAIILCFVIAGTTTVMSVDALRDGLFELIEKVYTRFSQITFESVQSSYSAPEVFEEYNLTDVPEGFSLKSNFIDETIYVKEQKFTNGDQSINFGQHLAEKADFSVDTEGTTTETIEYKDKEILCFSNKGVQYALWTEGDYAFIIHSDLPMGQVLEMAASVEK